MTHWTFYPHLEALLKECLDLYNGVLKEHLVGVYLRGSLALGDFDPETSDVDLLVVLTHPLADEELAALRAWHDPFRTEHRLPHLEVFFVDQHSLQALDFSEPVHGSVGPDWDLQRCALGGNALLECWIVREHARAVKGPDPRTLIPVISPERLKEAVMQELLSWNQQEATPNWLLRRDYQAFAVQTMCRALYTLHFGTLPTKPRAVHWATQALPEWAPLLRQVESWRQDPTEDPEQLRETMTFVFAVSGQPQKLLGPSGP